MINEENTKDLVKEILAIEWDLFQQVQTLSGKKASCQKDHKTFLIMRLSQLLAWPEKIQMSYLNDLLSAKASGRNLMAEKYAHMMKYSDPDAYMKLAHLLPQISTEKQEYIDGIISLVLFWAKEMRLEYPNLLSAGRPIDAFMDAVHTTSMETYLRGELLTYSDETVFQLCVYLIECLRDHRNYYKEVLSTTIKLYGYSSFSHAEAALSSNS